MSWLMVCEEIVNLSVDSGFDVHFQYMGRIYYYILLYSTVNRDFSSHTGRPLPLSPLDLFWLPG